jgi:ethanolamine utilization protein EutN
MIIGKVTGTIDSTINHPFYDGKKLLVVDKVDAGGKSSGDYLVAIDTADAGIGETVLVIDEGNSSRQVFAADNAPVRSTVVGIIDAVEAG